MTEGHPLSPRNAPGVLLARGVCRFLVSLDFAPLVEFSPERGLRVDVMAIGPKGEIWIIECKSGRSDYVSDRKWHRYLPWCDRFFWAVEATFPTELLPEETGLMIGDGFGAEILRTPPDSPIPAARRKALTRAFGRSSALRLARELDPPIGQSFGS
ncbi:MAG: MmcB family DNA repair protein [Roseinatronobacter sp.]